MLKIEKEIFDYYLSIIKNKGEKTKYKNEIFFKDKKEIEKELIINFYELLFKDFKVEEINSVLLQKYFLEKKELTQEYEILELQIFKEGKIIDISNFFQHIFIKNNELEEKIIFKILLINLSIFLKNLNIDFLDNSYEIFIKKTVYTGLFVKDKFNIFTEKNDPKKQSYFVLYQKNGIDIYTSKYVYEKIFNLINTKDYSNFKNIYNLEQGENFLVEINKLLECDFEKIFFEYVLKNNIYLENFFLKKDFLILDRMNEKLNLKLLLDYEKEIFLQREENIFTKYMRNFFTVEKIKEEMKKSKESIYTNYFLFNVSTNKLEREESFQYLFLENINNMMNENMEIINKDKKMNLTSLSYTLNAF